MLSTYCRNNVIDIEKCLSVVECGKTLGNSSRLHQHSKLFQHLRVLVNTFQYLSHTETYWVANDYLCLRLRTGDGVPCLEWVRKSQRSRDRANRYKNSIFIDSMQH